MQEKLPQTRNPTYHTRIAKRILTDTTVLVPIQLVAVRAATDVGTERVLTFPALADALHLHTLVDV